MTPYLEYPQLLSVLLRMLNEGEGSVHIRREVLKVKHPVVVNLIQKVLSDLQNCRLAEFGHRWGAWR